LKVLFVATVMIHFKSFHLPYMRWFQKQGWKVHVAANKDIELPYCDKKYVIPIERSPYKLNNIVAYTQLKEILHQNKYDMIHCHTPMGGVLARLAARDTKKSGTKVFYTAHGFHFFKGAPMMYWLIYYPIERFLARYTDVLITINKEDYARAQQFRAKKIVYVPGVGVDTQRFNSINIDRSVKRAMLGITEGKLVLLSVGELSNNKNHEVVIKGIAKLREHNIIYVICGCGQLDGYLKNLARKYRVDVRLLGFREDISEICAASDIFVFPSLREGLPVALIEAMATGLPVVCSNIRGNTDLIENGKGGYLVEPEDVEGFAKAIEKTVENRSLMGHFNTEIIKHFDLMSVKEEMKKIYGNGMIKKY